MARNDNPDEFYSDPTQAANYGGGSGGQAYSEVPPEQTAGYGYPADYQTGYGTEYQTGYAAAPEPPTPWYRKPAALVALGAATALILALVIYAIVQLAGGSSTPTGETTTTTPTTTEAPTETGGTQVPAPVETQTVTETPTTTAAPPPEETTTEAPTETTTATTEPPTETTTTTTEAPPTETVTETETVRPTWTRPTLPTLFPRPGGGEGQ